MKILQILLFLLISVLLNGNTIYLSPNGQDTNPGTFGEPIFTLSRAWDLVSPGDTIYLRGGTYLYTATQFLEGKNGTAAKPIRVWAFPNEVPIITKGITCNYKWNSGIAFKGDYFHWRGIEITGFTQETSSIYVGLRITDAKNNIFELINSHHNGHGCVITGKSDNNLVLNCDFHHNQDPLSSPKFGNADGLEICYIQVGCTNTIRGCRIYWNSDDGIDLWNNDGKVIIENCWSWNNGYIPGTFTPAGNGNGIKLGKTTQDHKSTILRVVTNSITYHNRTRGFDQNEALCSMELYNNTAFLNGTNGYVLNYKNIFTIVKNCLSYKNAFLPGISTSAIAVHNVFVDNNLTIDKHSVSDKDFISLDSSELLRPRKPDGSLPDIDFLKLAPESSLIDAGVDVGLPYWGSAPDIGAFEVVKGEYHKNQPPIVELSFHNKTTVLTAPATVTVNVEATDQDGEIRSVELFNGTTVITTSSQETFSFTLKDLAEGKYKLKAVATDNLGVSATSSMLEFEVIAPPAMRESFNLYPNPNDGLFSIEFETLEEPGMYSFSVCSRDGRILFRQELPQGEAIRHFDLSFLLPDIYIAMISTEKNILSTRKFIKL